MIEENRAQIIEDLTVFERSVKAVINQSPELVAKYNNQWIAVHDGVVVSSGPTHQEVLDEVDEKELRRSQVNIEYLTDDPPRMIL